MDVQTIVKNTVTNCIIVVIILTYNQRNKTLKCLSSLLDTNNSLFNILVWDNGSNDGTAAAITKAHPAVMVHYHPCNLGVASGRNAAAELAIKTFNPTHLLFLDNDMIVKPNFANALLQPFNRDEKLGQTQAKLRFMHDENRLNDGGGARISFMFWRVKPVGFGEVDNGQHDTAKKCISCGGAMMVRTDIFQKLGGFDEAFDPFGPEDLDFSLRLQKAGYIALYVPQAVAYHAVSHTFGEGYTEDYARHKFRHWFLFMRRHASLIEQLGFFFVGAPYLALRVLVREGRKGNLAAYRGLLMGPIDYFKSKLHLKQ